MCLRQNVYVIPLIWSSFVDDLKKKVVLRLLDTKKYAQHIDQYLKWTSGQDKCRDVKVVTLHRETLSIPTSDGPIPIHFF